MKTRPLFTSLCGVALVFGASHAIAQTKAEKTLKTGEQVFDVHLALSRWLPRQSREGRGFPGHNSPDFLLRDAHARARECSWPR